MPDRKEKLPALSGPLRILREAIKAVPAVKYALGVAGIASAVALAYSLRLDPKVTVLGTPVMLILMAVLVVFARLASLSKGYLFGPAIILAWFALLLLMVVSTLLVSCFFFRRPLDLSGWLEERGAADHGAKAVRKPEIYALRIQVLDPDGRPVSGSRIRTSVGNEPQLLPDGWWQVEIPAAKVPADGMVSVWVEHEAWEGNRGSVLLAGDPNPQLVMRLRPPQAVVRGRVVDPKDRGLGDVRVSPQDGGAGTATTDASGRFELTLPVPRETRVRLRAESAGHPLGDAFCYAGRDTCRIVLENR